MKKLCLALAITLISCAEEKTKKPATSSGSKTGAASTEDVCTSLNASSFASSEFRDIVSELCTGTTLTNLRSATYAYADANAAPNPAIKASSSGTTSSMKLWASLLPATDPRSYFNLMRLQISRPSDYSASGFEVDSFITYTVNSTTTNSTNYRYLNRRGDGDAVVEYIADSNYTEVAANQLYVVTSKFVSAPSDSVMKSFRGFQVIFKSSSGSTEVFSYAEQTYDNKGDHQKTVNEATDALKDDMKRAMRNATKATTANSFFP
jgi:hypothetical protein